MSVIPCQENPELREQIVEFAEVLKDEAHTLGNHGLSKEEFYASGLFRGAIERIRGQFAATMREKREFMSDVLNYMEDRDFISGWEAAGSENRYDYAISLPNGRTAAVELKGCLDGNNTNIFERPPHAHEFIIWSVCTNAGADPRHNAWSGIHTRLSAEIISGEQRVDGAVIWDMVCGTLGRPCPKAPQGAGRRTEVAEYQLPPPCIYLFPATIPSPRNNPHPPAQDLEDVEILEALHECFGGNEDEVNYVDFEVAYEGAETVRTTTIRRGGAVQERSNPTAIQRA